MPQKRNSSLRRTRNRATILQLGDSIMQLKYILCALFLLIFALILWERTRIDVFFFRQWQNLKARFSKNSKIERNLQQEIEWLQYLLLSLRSGESLESALSSRGKCSSQTNSARKSRSILAKNPESDPISMLLQASMHSGAPCVATLQFIRKAKMAEVRDRRKLRALTLGARIQSIILAFIPWILLGSFFFIDNELAHSLVNNVLCWLVWSFAFLLCLVGFRWMRSIMNRNINARDPLIRECEEQLPEFLLDLIVMVGSGRDINDSKISAAQKLPISSRFRAFILDVNAPSPNSIWTSIRDLLRKAEESGSPMREEIFLFLQELQNQKECRWEELAQKLPSQLLAPLFACFFFASLLMSFSLMVPFLEGF